MKTKYMTYRDLKAKLDGLTDEQLDSKMIWWGDERGGIIHDVLTLDEEHVSVDDEFMTPRSAFAEGEFDEQAARVRDGKLARHARRSGRQHP